MGYYNVIRECVVGKLHYARPTTQPIEVDDDVAEPLVADGSLQPYEPGGVSVADQRLAKAQERTDRAAEDLANAQDRGRAAGDEFTRAITEAAAGDRPSLPTEPPAKPRRGRRSES